MFISLMFAGHHTTSTTSSWALLELLPPSRVDGARRRRARRALRRRRRRLVPGAARDPASSRACFKETLRLHPPLILLMRKVVQPFEHKDWRVEAGQMVGVSIAVSNRDPERCSAIRSASTRAASSRAAKRTSASSRYIPFGAGRHRCVGAAFAMMQLKAIFSILLRRYEFELAQPPETLPRATTRRWSCSSPSRVACDTAAAPPRSEPQASEVHRDATRAARDPHRARRRRPRPLSGPRRLRRTKRPSCSRSTRTTKKVVVLDPAPPEALRPKLDAAVRYCPTHALRIVEE